MNSNCIKTKVDLQCAHLYGESGLTHPVPHVKEALLISEVKEQQEAHGVPEERCGQTPKPAFRGENITWNISDSSQHVRKQCCQTINKSFCLHNICVCTVYIYCACVNTHTYSIYLENIYMYIYLHSYILYKYI